MNGGIVNWFLGQAGWFLNALAGLALHLAFWLLWGLAFWSLVFAVLYANFGQRIATWWEPVLVHRLRQDGEG